MLWLGWCHYRYPAPTFSRVCSGMIDVDLFVNIFLRLAGEFMQQFRFPFSLSLGRNRRICMDLPGFSTV